MLTEEQVARIAGDHLSNPVVRQIAELTVQISIIKTLLVNRGFCTEEEWQLLEARLRSYADQATCTDEEGIEATGMNGSTWRPRRGELIQLGLVVDSKTTRLTHSGRAATVWKVRSEA